MWFKIVEFHLIDSFKMACVCWCVCRHIFSCKISPCEHRRAFCSFVFFEEWLSVSWSKIISSCYNYQFSVTSLSGGCCFCDFLRVWVLWTFRYFHSTIQICLQCRLANVNKVNPSAWSPKSLRWKGSDMQILRADDLWWVLLFCCNRRLVGCQAYFDVTC